MITVKYNEYKKYLNEYPIVDLIENAMVTLKKPVVCYNSTTIFSYPFAYNYINIPDLKNIFKKLKNESCTNLDSDSTDIITIFKFRNDYDYIKLIDYFQELCRIKCKRNNQVQNTEEWFYENLNKITELTLKTSEISYLSIFDTIKKMHRTLCSEFNPLWALWIIKYFKSKMQVNKMLDMSAGRGSRMVGAMACDIEYVGVDPCECTNLKYETMHLFYSKKNKCTIYKSGFETLDINLLKNHGEFDLMFSSPPYFDLEIFEDNKTQSINKFNSLELWVVNFMYVCMHKIIQVLRIGGIMAINIDNPFNKTMDYITPILEFKDKNAKFIGKIIFKHNYIDYSTWCWEKI